MRIGQVREHERHFIDHPLNERTPTRNIRPGRLTLFAILATYVAAAISELPLVRHQINPDGIAYIHAARRWAAGNFHGAVNGCYSPLLSWLLVPFIRLGIDELLAGKIITFTGGAIGVVVVWRLTAHFTERLLLRAIATSAAGCMLLAWAGFLVTPDELVVVTMAAWLLFLLEPPTRGNAAAAGVAGGLMYLAKSYGFPFVVASLVMSLVWRAFSNSRAAVSEPRSAGRETFPTREHARATAITLAVFLVISIPWAIAVSIKYGKPTIGTAAAYNVGLIGPANGPVGSRNHPIRTLGLMPPSDPQAFSASDDLTYHPFPPWPGGSANVKRLVQNFVHNMGEIWQNIGGAAFIAAVLSIAMLKFVGDRRRNIVLALLLAAIYLGGYLILILEARYLWGIRIYMLLAAITLIDVVVGRWAIRPAVAALLAVASLSAFVWPPLVKLGEVRYSGAEYVENVAQVRMNAIDLRGRRVASLNNWDASMYQLYYFDAVYYGRPEPGASAAKIHEELDRYAIDTVLVWGDESERPQPLLDGWRKVALLNQGPVAIYQR